LNTTQTSGIRALWHLMLPAVIAGLVLAALPLPAPGSEHLPDEDSEFLYYDYIDDSGNLAGGRLIIPRQERYDGPVLREYTAEFTTIMDNGPSANRVNLVTVGDGYLESELGQYGQHVSSAIIELFALEPFYTYSTYFNVHQVDVISNESGVSNDPVPGIDRDTAMDMEFWCYDVERLLCVDVYKATMYAANAPGVDQIFAVANSTKYGGAGYPTANIGTFAGGNSVAPQIAIHELGHSLGNLADEYDYGGPAHYNGPEPAERNVSTLNHSQMAAAGTKWAPWLGENYPAFDGYHTTFEGAMYSQYGIHRPTYDSMMRSLGRPFNLPSAEALIIEIYKVVDPIDSSTPAGQSLSGDEIVFVQTLQPVGAPLDIQWLLDNQPIPGGTGETLDLALLELPDGIYELSVIVTDNIWMVRDAAARAQHLTQRIDWAVEVAGVTGGCCLPNSICIASSETWCGALLGAYLGDESDCSGADCPKAPDGEIAVWGCLNEEQCDVPAPNDDFLAVSGGFGHSLGLKLDGTIAAWGGNSHGQCDVPSPNEGFVDLSAGSSHSLGLKGDGVITAWGRNNFGQCNVPAPNTDFVAVSGGGNHSLGLRRLGAVAAWGDNTYGQSGPPSPNTGFTAIAAGVFHSLALRSDGTIAAWGRNNHGQCDVPGPNSGFIAIAAGTEHSLALRSDGTIAAWGRNNYGQCDVPAPNSGFTAIAAGYNHSLGLRSSGAVAAWGWNGYGQCDLPEPNAGFVAIAGGYYHSLAIGDFDAASAGETPLAASGPALGTASPNPFNPGTTMWLQLPQPSDVSLTVHDPAGRLVRTLRQGAMGPGRHPVAWDGRDERGQALPSGIYLVRMATEDGAVRTAKVTLAR